MTKTAVWTIIIAESMRVPKEEKVMKFRKILKITAAVIIISPYLIRVMPETLLAIAGYAIVNGKIVKNLCESGEL